jgi:hypothetical protein
MTEAGIAAPMKLDTVIYPSPKMFYITLRDNSLSNKFTRGSCGFIKYCTFRHLDNFVKI